MTTKTRRPADIIRDQRADIDATVSEYHQRRDAVRWRTDLSETGKADVARAVRDQYRANLESDATSSWRIATAAVETAKASYKAAYAKHAATGDPARLAWRARELAARLAGGAAAGPHVGAFDTVGWLARERDRLAEVNDVEGLRALRTVAREMYSSIGDNEAATRLEVALRKDEADEAADVLAARREVVEAERAADDLRRRILDAQTAIDPNAGHPLAGSDGFRVKVFGEDRATTGIVMPAAPAPAVA